MLGQVCLCRTADEPWFSATEERSLAGIAVSLGAALRQAHVLTQSEPGSPEEPGVLLLGEDGRPAGCSESAEQLLGELPDDGTPLPSTVYEVATRAQVLAASGSGPPATARVRGRAGRYLVVRGSVLSGDPGGARVAVLLEPARRPDLAPLVMAAAALTAREREVTALFLSGTGEAEIARRLWLSAHTVHGYVKAIFAKLNVGSRAELAALLGEVAEPGAAARPSGQASPPTRP